MHKSEPTFIIMKRRIAGPEIIDPGMGFSSARKAMIHADGLDAGSPCAAVAGPDQPDLPDQSDEPAGDHQAEMKKMADELYKASEMHKGQADKLMSFVEGNPHNDSGSYGKKKEL
jgi:hypothetical protein